MFKMQWPLASLKNINIITNMRITIGTFIKSYVLDSIIPEKIIHGTINLSSFNA
jgi:hypothetical protein